MSGNRRPDNHHRDLPARRDPAPRWVPDDRPLTAAAGSGQSERSRSDAQQWHRIVDALAVIASLVRDHDEPDDLAAALTAGAAQAVGADLAMLRLARLEARTLENRVIHGFDQRVREALHGLTSSLFDSQSVLASPRSSVFSFADGPPTGFARQEVDELQRRGIAHVLTVPLLHQGVLIGRLDLLTALREPFSDEQRTVAEALGAIIASTLSDDRHEVDEAASKVSTVRLTPPSFEDISDAREMFQYLVHWLHEMLGPRQCYGFTWNETKETFSPVAVTGGQPDAVRALKQIHLRPAAVPALREAIHSDGPYIIPDARETSLMPPEMASALDLQQVVILSLTGSGGQLVGSIMLDFPTQQELSDTFLGVILQAGNYASIMLENALLYEAVQRSSENLAIVNEIGIELATLSDLDSLFRLVFYHIHSVMEATCFAVGLTLPERKNVEYRYAVENRIAEEPVTLPLGRDALSQVIQTGRPQVATDAASVQHGDWFPIVDGMDTLQSAIAVPVVVGHETIGVLTAQSESPGAYAADVLDLMTTVGMQLGAAIQNARLYAIVHARGERRGYLLDHVISQQEAERKMVVDDIHNETLQTMAHSLVQLDLLRQRASDAPIDEMRDEITRVRDTLSANIDELRETIFQLRPSTLDVLGLESALREYFKHFQDDTGIRAELEIDLPDRFGGVAETRVYRLVQEAVDTIRHRREVTRIVFRIRQRDQDILVTIADDGHGVSTDFLNETDRPRKRDYTDIERRLMSLRERAELAGGSLHLTRRTTGGSLIQVVIPYGDGEG